MTEATTQPTEAQPLPKNLPKASLFSDNLTKVEISNN